MSSTEAFLGFTINFFAFEIWSTFTAIVWEFGSVLWTKKLHWTFHWQTMTEFSFLGEQLKALKTQGNSEPCIIITVAK